MPKIFYSIFSSEIIEKIQTVNIDVMSKNRIIGQNFAQPGHPEFIIEVLLQRRKPLKSFFSRER